MFCFFITPLSRTDVSIAALFAGLFAGRVPRRRMFCNPALLTTNASRCSLNGYSSGNLTRERAGKGHRLSENENLFFRNLIEQFW